MSRTNVESFVAGKVWEVLKQAGDTVATGDALLILESMKMEIPVEAPVDGVVQDILVAEGAEVEEGEVLAVLTST